MRYISVNISSLEINIKEEKRQANDRNEIEVVIYMMGNEGVGVHTGVRVVLTWVRERC